MRTLTTACILIASAAAAQAAPAPFVLARGGKPAATIVVASSATTAARFAAAELQTHLHRITGATLPIVTDEQPVSGARVLVGESAATRAFGLRSATFRSQEYLVRIRPNTLVLIGRDADDLPGTSPRRAPGRHGRALRFTGTQAISLPEPGFNDEAGTLEAWVWLPAEQPERDGTILRLDGADPWTYHIIQRDANSNRITYRTYDGKEVRAIGAEVTAGWHHVRGTYDARAGQIELFIDGASRGTAPYARTTCREVPLQIGGIPQSGGTPGNPFVGLIDEVRLSTTVRDATQAAGGPYTPDAHTGVLLHCDEADGLPVSNAAGSRSLPLPGLYDDHGTLDAVYDFLERHCDVRWYAPGEVGLVHPRRATLAVRGPDVRRSPAMIHRSITPVPLYIPGPPHKVPHREAEVWKLRLRLGGQAFWVCHSFEGYYDRFLKEHPDWFAQGYSGRPPQMCYTNEGFIQQVIQDARDYFDGKGAPPGATATGDVYGLVPQDNVSWCRCARCQAELNPAEANNLQFNNGKASDYVFRFVNRVAREVRKTHPDKWIGALAYSDYAYYPTKEKVEPNVVMQLCLHTRNWWCPSMEANDRKVLAEWRRQDPERPLYVWLYYNFPALNAQYDGFGYFPGFFAHSVVTQMRLYQKARVQGIFMEHSSEFGQSTLMDQLEFYVTLKLADDPSLDGQKLIDEFFTRYYGAAAGPMRKLYTRIEQTFTNPACYPEAIQQSPGHQHQTEELAWGALGTEARMAEFARLMAQAREAARTPLEKERVALFEQGIWNQMVEGRRKYLERQQRRTQAPPRVTVPAVPPAEGDPARVDWSRAADLGQWATLVGEPTTRKVEGRVAHDGHYLYVQLAEELDPATLVASPQVFDGDDWEGFFATQRGAGARQICVGPKGAHLAVARGEEKETWDSGAVVVSDTVDGRWRVRLALPLARLVPGGAKPGEVVYAGFYRASPGARDLLAWSPTFGGGFHNTSRLGELVLEANTPAAGAGALFMAPRGGNALGR